MQSVIKLHLRGVSVLNIIILVHYRNNNIAPLGAYVKKGHFVAVHCIVAVDGDYGAAYRKSGGGDDVNAYNAEKIFCFSFPLGSHFYFSFPMDISASAMPSADSSPAYTACSKLFP